MSGSLAAIITIPIVAFIALFSWLFAVLWASTHPRYRSSGSPPRTEVAGGAFHAVGGGRQLMPIPEHRPAGIPAPRAAEAESARAAGSAGATSVPGPRAETSQPVYGGEAAPESQPLAGAARRGHGLERGASALGRDDLRLLGGAQPIRFGSGQHTAAAAAGVPAVWRPPGQLMGPVWISWSAPRYC